MFAQIQDGNARLLEGQPFEVGDIQYPGNIIYLWPEEDLAEIGVYPIAEPPAPPVGQVETSRSLTVVDGLPVWNATFGSAPVPVKVHKVWLIRVLETHGLMDDLEDDMDAAWAAGNKAIKRYWLAASDIYRNDPILVAFAADRQWPPEQLDAWFIQAAAYQAANASNQ